MKSGSQIKNSFFSGSTLLLKGLESKLTSSGMGGKSKCSPIPTSSEPPVAQPRQQRVLYPYEDGAIEVLRIQEKVTARPAVYHYNRCQVEVQRCMQLMYPKKPVDLNLVPIWPDQFDQILAIYYYCWTLWQNEKKKTKSSALPLYRSKWCKGNHHWYRHGWDHQMFRSSFIQSFPSSCCRISHLYTSSLCFLSL